jgi:Phosphodiester glycosidase
MLVAAVLVLVAGLLLVLRAVDRPVLGRVEQARHGPITTASVSAETAHPFSVASGHLDLSIEHSTPVADGVVLHEIVQRRGGPNVIHVLEIDPQAKATLDMTGAGRAYPALAPTSKMGEQHDALAAINGEFFELPGRPEFLFQSDGTLWQTALHKSNMFAISEDERRIYVDRIAPTISAEDLTARKAVPVSDWNTVDPSGSRIVGYTPIGGNVAAPPANACTALLAANGPIEWSQGRSGVEQTFTAGDARCGGATPRFHGRDSVILASTRGGGGERALRRLDPGHQIRVSWTFGFPDVLDVAGGQPVLVKNAESDLPPKCKTAFCAPQPRTAVGYTADGRVLMATDDGRQAGYSVGMSLQEWTDVFLQMGATGALNLDGGGSTTMWVRGLGVVNRPSNPGHAERPVGTAMLVLPGLDTDMPKSLVRTSGQK